MRLRSAAGLLAGVLAGCQSLVPSPHPSVASPRPGTEAPATWTAFLHDPQRTGQDSTQPPISQPHAIWTSERLDGQVYASPLAYRGLVIAATENDTVYGIDLGTGRQHWKTHLGDPFPSSSLPCGDIGPSVGVTSTPVIDSARSRLYVVAMVASGEYHLYGLDLEHGGVSMDRKLDLRGLDSKVENQRGALSLDADRVLIPFGGRTGDCGAYHGLMLGEALSDSAEMAVAYRVPSGREAGIWTPGGETVASDGSIWTATGNSAPTSQYDEANSVLELSNNLALRDTFAPSDWLPLNLTDSDLGSSTPTLIGDGLVFIAGKSAVGYLLNREHLGGVGGQVFSAKVCSGYGQAIYSAPYAYVPCGDGLVAIRVDESHRTFQVAWRSPSFHAGSPILVGGTVWVLDVDGGVLNGFDPVSGKVTARVTIGTANHFATPSAGGGLVIAASQTQITAVG